ncbi:MAG: OmpA family protein [Bacteroidota bacterium]
MLLKKAISIEPDYVDAYYELARMSIWAKSYGAAKKYLIKVIEICPSFNIYAHYYLGDIYYGSGEDDEALKYLREFIKHPDDIKSDRDYNRAELLIKSAEFFSRMYNNPVPFEPKSVEGICTQLDEYLPAISADNEIAFFTRRYKKKSLGDLNSIEVEQFTYSERVDGKFTRGKPMPPPFNRGMNEGGATLTIENKRMYFTICKTTTTGYYNCDIYSADYIYNDPEEFKKLVEEEEKRFGKRDIQLEDIPEFRWDNIRNLDEDLPSGGIGVNSINTWESQPSISPDGKILYYTSDRKGGYGGYDIYKTVFFDSTSKWSQPVNMGSMINTKGNEKSPFIHPDDQTFYFSSDSLRGLGGYDIFFTKKGDDGQWQKPKNIGYPINTEEDDLGFFVSTDGKTGYFSSNLTIHTSARDSVQQQAGKTTVRVKGEGGWDLYSFPLYKDARPEKVLFLKGQLKDEQGEVLVEAEMELKNVRTKEINKVNVDSESGKYATVITLEQEDDFIMKVKKDDYAFTTKYISTKEPIYYAPSKIDFEVKEIEVGDTYHLNNINFATNSTNVLTDVSLTILDDFVEFLEDNPYMTVEIHGHTDNVGSSEDNMELSKNRAKAVNDYLILNGIENSRLTYRWFGETKPVTSNDTDEDRAMNRRTEFLVTSR